MKVIWPIYSCRVFTNACLDQAWTCSYSPPKNPTKDRRCLSKLPLFAANVESREFCLEQYVKFGNTYIHPTLDLIYITWYWAENTSSQEDTKFYPIHGQPLTRFRRVALSLGRNPAFNGRFGALADCVRHLGSPEEVMLTLAGPNLPTVHTLAEGFSISNGNQVSLLDWPANPQTTTANSGSNNGESSMAMANALRLSVIEALEVAQTKRTAFKLPTIDKKLYYFNSGP